MPVLTLEGRRAHYVHRGGPPGGRLVAAFIHGAGGTHQHWLYQVRDVPGATTLAVDLPGHGASAGSGRDTISGCGDWLVGFLDAVGAAHAILVGHSMGGGIALDVALRYPGKVMGLALVAAGARLRVAPAIFEALRQDVQAAVQLFSDYAYGPEAAADLVRLGRRQMAQIPADVLLDDLNACDAFDVMGRLGEITVPTVVVCGTKDALTPAKYSTYLHDHIPHSSLQFIEGAGHMVMVENPGAVSRALAAFVGEAAL